MVHQTRDTLKSKIQLSAHNFTTNRELVPGNRKKMPTISVDQEMFDTPYKNKDWANKNNKGDNTTSIIIRNKPFPKDLDQSDFRFMLGLPLRYSSSAPETYF